jgi:hypothetical protein
MERISRTTRLSFAFSPEIPERIRARFEPLKDFTFPRSVFTGYTGYDVGKRRLALAADCFLVGSARSLVLLSGRVIGTGEEVNLALAVHDAGNFALLKAPYVILNCADDQPCQVVQLIEVRIKKRIDLTLTGQKVSIPKAATLPPPPPPIIAPPPPPPVPPEPPKLPEPPKPPAETGKPKKPERPKNAKLPKLIYVDTPEGRENYIRALAAHFPEVEDIDKIRQVVAVYGESSALCLATRLGKKIKQ